MHTNTRDPDVLLCESCGYPIEGLAPDAVCPECGRRVADSLPARRPGSAWQRRPSLGAGVATGIAVLMHPISIWGRVWIERRRSLWLVAVNSCIAGLLAVAAPAAIAWRADDSMMAVLLLTVGGAWIGGVVALLTWIEFLGIRFFGNRRGWRITKPVAWTVCAHAGVGWVVGGALVSALFLVGATLTSTYPVLTTARATATVVLIPSASMLLVLGGALVGMLLFETLVYVGMRECRFGNVTEETKRRRDEETK